MIVRNIQRHDRVRTGVAMLFVLVVFAVLSVMLTEAARHAAASRQFLEIRNNRLQAVWLARAGTEWAANRLLTDGAKYHGETVDLTPGGRVRIAVEPVAASAHEYRIRCAVVYPVNGLRPVNLETSRIARQTAESGRTRIDLGTRVNLVWSAATGIVVAPA